MGGWGRPGLGRAPNPPSPLGKANTENKIWNTELRVAKTVVAGTVGANCGEANLTHCGPGGGGGGTRPWWLALLACGGAYWPLAPEPSAMTSGHPYYCRHPHCCGASTFLGGGGGNPECSFCPWRPPLTA